MPLARKTDGYPVAAGAVAAAIVEPLTTAAPSRIGSGTPVVQPSAKDRSIVRQVAWKVAGFAMANWSGTPESWFDKCVEIRAKIEKDILEA